MTWKQMLDTMLCTECGRCQDVCPAYATGKALSPKLLIIAMRDNLLSGATTPVVPGSVSADVVCACVPCAARVPMGPRNIGHRAHTPALPLTPLLPPSPSPHLPRTIL